MQVGPSAVNRHRPVTWIHRIQSLYPTFVNNVVDMHNSYKRWSTTLRKNELSKYKQRTRMKNAITSPARIAYKCPQRSGWVLYITFIK